MKTVNLHAAKTQLSKLVEDAVAGEEIVIANAGQPMVRLVPVEPTKRRGFGAYRGKLTVPPDFDDPLPPEILKAFGVKG